MAFGLFGSLDSLLGADSRLTSENINPQNLSSFGFDAAWKLPEIYQQYDEESADREVDAAVQLAEVRTQQTRIVEAYTHLAEVDLKFQREAKKLRNKLADLEITREEAFAQWEALQHKVQVAGRRAGLQKANDIEQANISYASFSRGLQRKLSKATDTSRSGTHEGSPRLRHPLRLVS